MRGQGHGEGHRHRHGGTEECKAQPTKALSQARREVKKSALLYLTCA